MSALIGQIVAFIVAGLAILGLVPHQQPQPIPQLPQQVIQQPTNPAAPNISQPSSKGTQTYTNTQYRFSIQYPEGLQAHVPGSTDQYGITINRAAWLVEIGQIKKQFTTSEYGWGNDGYTAAAQGKVIVGVSMDSNDVANCMSAPDIGNVMQSSITHKTINGTHFLSYEAGDPALGLYRLTQIYQTLHNGICFSILEQIDGGESSHMNKTDAVANDKMLSDILAQLDAIATSFKFTDTLAVVSVPGMSKYTDADFGFSFWYPNEWKVIQVPQPILVPMKDAMLQKVLKISGDYGGVPDGYVIEISEYYSPGRRITSAGYECPAGSGCPAQSIYFDKTGHKWMIQYPNGNNPNSAVYESNLPPGAIVSADVSHNTMGGLHLLGRALDRGFSTIIPLSAQNFLVVSDLGAQIDRTGLANTIVATDQSAGTPVSADEQIKTIQAEKDAYAGQ